MECDNHNLRKMCPFNELRIIDFLTSCALPLTGTLLISNSLWEALMGTPPPKKKDAEVYYLFLVRRRRTDRGGLSRGREDLILRSCARCIAQHFSKKTIQIMCYFFRYWPFRFVSTLPYK
jgi:hypothetical protein